MALWNVAPDPDRLNETARNTLVEHLGIEFLAAGDDCLRARMPVDRRTVQPYGLLHGGASAALAETLGSVASTLCVDRGTQRVAGLELNANHVRSVREGWVTGTCRPLHVGRGTHVWDIRIEDGDGRLVCVSRVTVAVLDKQGGLRRCAGGLRRLNPPLRCRRSPGSPRPGPPRLS